MPRRKAIKEAQAGAKTMLTMLGKPWKGFGGRLRGDRCLSLAGFRSQAEVVARSARIQSE